MPLPTRSPADHLAAMLAVGAWSALTVTPAWRAPAAFVALLVAGALAGFAGLWVPGVEPMIAASVLVLGLLVAVQKDALGAGRCAGGRVRLLPWRRPWL
jgi:hydrogenase/urease accessory protein HupE